MLNISIPYQKLLHLLEKLEIKEEELGGLEPFHHLFTSRKDEYAAYLHHYFLAIPETRVLLEHLEHPGHLIRAWAYWFETLFTEKPGKDFAARLWRVGLRHVEVNLDQRYTNLGFSITRQFCNQIVRASIPAEEAVAVSHTIGKLLDFCLLVETSAYIEATTRCDLEVIKGIADKVRNPVTVIGGNIKRLQRKVATGDPLYDIYGSLFSENMRLERMVLDIKNYIDMFNGEPHIGPLSLEEIVAHTIARLEAERQRETVRIEKAFDPTCPYVEGDRREMEFLFYYLLQNSFEAVDPENPLIRISSCLEEAPYRCIVVEIFNTGVPPKEEDLEKLFSPFYSTKSFGTGFGLPIARLAVRKNYGKLELIPVPGEGTKVRVTLSTARV
ncbi:MAG: ATP-binding protein [Thermodesulfovibrionales bacterium]